MNIILLDLDVQVVNTILKAVKFASLFPLLNKVISHKIVKF
jgi:hypothetical protein